GESWNSAIENYCTVVSGHLTQIWILALAYLQIRYASLPVYREAVGSFEAPGDSDHSPCVVDFSTEEVRRKSTFKYFYFIETHPHFVSVLKSTWEEEVQFCRKLNKEDFGNIQPKASKAMHALKDV
ncbi:hypothetical protein HID58_038191, partial [Brassica napus]